MEMICQKPGSSGETKHRSGDKNKSSSPMTNLVGQNAYSSGEKNKSSPKPMDEMEMINQTAGAYKGKMKRCTKLNHGRSGDKKKSFPKPNLVEMVSESGAVASGEKKNYSPKPKLKYERSDMAPRKEDMESDAFLMAFYERWCCYHKMDRSPGEMKERFKYFKKDAISLYERWCQMLAERSDMAPRKEDMESDASLMAFYERWCCYHKMDRSPDEMKERFKYFKKDAISLYKFNKDRTSAPYVLWYFSDWSPEESRLPGYCLPSPPVSDDEKSFPKPNLVDMVSESGAGASGEKYNSSPKPKLKYKRSDMAPRKEDIESDASLMAFYERWCCYHKVDRSPDEMKERFKYFKKDAISAYKANKDRTSASYVLWYFSDWTPEESWLPGYCLPSPPVSDKERRRLPGYCLPSPPFSDEEMRRLRMHSRRRRMRRIQWVLPRSWGH